MRQIKIAIAFIVWILVGLQLAALFDAIHTRKAVDGLIVAGIPLVVIVLTIIQFSIKVK